MHVSRYIKIYPASDDPDRVLIYSTLRGAVLQVSHAVAAALLSNTLEGEERETMAQLGILVPDALAEQRQVAGYFDWANANARRNATISSAAGLSGLDAVAFTAPK